MDFGPGHENDSDSIDSEPLTGAAKTVASADGQAGHSPHHSSQPAPPGGLWRHPTGGIRQHSRFGTLRDAIEYYDKSNASDSAEHRTSELASYIGSAYRTH